MWPRLAQALDGRTRGSSGLATLSADKPDHVALAAGLAALLRLKLGDTAALLSNTLSGQANALDVVVGSEFSTGNAGTNDI